MKSTRPYSLKSSISSQNYGNSLTSDALTVLGADYDFPNKLPGLPHRLSDFTDLKINSFVTSDGVKLRYWEAGQGESLIFVPGWSANGAEYINVMYLLSSHFRVIVLDQRNQGLSDKVPFGNRIARYSADLKDLTEHLKIEQANFCGWSMGASVIWSYIDLFGSASIRKAVFVDEAVSLVARSHWSEQQCINAGAGVNTPDALVKLLQMPLEGEADPTSSNPLNRFMLRDSPYFANSEGFAEAIINNDMKMMMQVMYDHASNDWSDVLKYKMNMPVAIFTGEYSACLESQYWAQSLIPNAKLYVYTKQEQGDHFLMFKNPHKFTTDLRTFLQKNVT